MKKVGDWWVPDNDAALSHMALNDYQRPVRELALKHVKKFDVAIDIGAHIGLWSKHLARKFKSLYAFEPVPDHRECFKQNVTGKNVALLPIALGERVGTTTLHIAKECSGGSHLIGEDGEVELSTLDTFDLAPDLIKIDVEGWEIRVLDGAVDTLMANKPIVIIEQKPNIHFGFEKYAASEFLKSLGAKEIGHVVDDWVFGW